ncbi:hypothetical protein JMJ35_004641 [Cladonia borealis]|uniref:Uncharacterized protein n=1 Tax=Cladonia borealis TaxID=184061 RepID=A0AA39V5J0_9LECA|nr:hypothetical protein JMJ35_004641 [Cladonia borealis]
MIYIATYLKYDDDDHTVLSLKAPYSVKGKELYSSPGATTAERVRENAGAVESTAKEMGVIEGVLRGFEVIGDHYHPVSMTMVNGKGE